MFDPTCRPLQVRAWLTAALLLSATLVQGLLPGEAQAVPAFNRQTSQNCVACHAGGQFPELTAYGRLFKLTGYTMSAAARPTVGGLYTTQQSGARQT